MWKSVIFATYVGKNMHSGFSQECSGMIDTSFAQHIIMQAFAPLFASITAEVASANSASSSNILIGSIDLNDNNEQIGERFQIEELPDVRYIVGSEVQSVYPGPFTSRYVTWERFCFCCGI